MIDDQEMVQVSHLVPEDVKEDARENAQHGDLSEAVRQAYEIVADGDDYEDRFRLEQRLERTRSEYESLVEQKERIEREMRDLKSQIGRLESKLESIEEADAEYNESLKDLTVSLRQGEHLFPSHAAVQEAAELGNCEARDVIQELKDRNPEIPDDAFVPAHEAEFGWDGVDV